MISFAKAKRAQPISNDAQAASSSAQSGRDGFSETIIQVVERVGPAVISVRRTGRAKDVYDGAGSGVIVSSDGYALTNHHVVKGAGRVEGVLHDGRVVGAEIIGVDPDTDLAVLRLQGHGHVAAQLGDSDSLRVGELAIAI